jgi:hypothetical protein
MYRGPLHVWRSQGMRGMWRGQAVTGMRELVYGSLYFSVFEHLKHYAAVLTGAKQRSSVATVRKKNEQSFVWTCLNMFFVQGTSQGLSYGALLLCGGATGATVWSVMFPIDVVKSKMQSDKAVSGPGALAVATAHWKAEGVAGFFKGWSAAMARSLPAHAVVLATYSKIMQILL